MPDPPSLILSKQRQLTTRVQHCAAPGNGTETQSPGRRELNLASDHVWFGDRGAGLGELPYRGRPFHSGKGEMVEYKSNHRTATQPQNVKRETKSANIKRKKSVSIRRELAPLWGSSPHGGSERLASGGFCRTRIRTRVGANKK